MLAFLSTSRHLFTPFEQRFKHVCQSELVIFSEKIMSLNEYSQL